jgi:hypothetical protein
MSTKRSALNRLTAYGWYLGSAFWRDAPTIFVRNAGSGPRRKFTTSLMCGSSMNMCGSSMNFRLT